MPGDVVLSPTGLAGLVLLIANDHLLKGRAPGWLTGKLSDVVGLYAFPLVVLGALEVGLWAAGRRQGAAPRVPRRWFAAIVVAVAVGFAAIKLAGPAGHAYQAGIGALRWLATAPIAAAVGANPGPPGSAALVRDPSDVPAVAMVWLAWRTARGRTT
ncbi:MAG: hypothetical protein ACRD07_13565 [Acidimicrobiales bacterium]